MAFCNMCGAQIADGTTTCAACAGRAATASPVPQATASTGGMTDNVAGMLAYITIIPAIIFLVMEPYNKNRFVRFHAFQNLFFCTWRGSSIWIAFASSLPFCRSSRLARPSDYVFRWLALVVGFFIIWIILLLKANQGQMWKLPVIGDLAEKQANAM